MVGVDVRDDVNDVVLMLMKMLVMKLVTILML